MIVACFKIANYCLALNISNNSIYGFEYTRLGAKRSSIEFYSVSIDNLNEDTHRVVQYFSGIRLDQASANLGLVYGTDDLNSGNYNWNFIVYNGVYTRTVITGENIKDIIGSVVLTQTTNSSGCETAHASETPQALVGVLCACVFAEKLVSKTTQLSLMIMVIIFISQVLLA